MGKINLYGAIASILVLLLMILNYRLSSSTFKYKGNNGKCNIHRISILGLVFLVFVNIFGKRVFFVSFSNAHIKRKLNKKYFLYLGDGLFHWKRIGED